MTETAVEIGLSLMVNEAFNEEKACEHTHHSEPSQSGAHEGNAKWYAQGLCTDCGRKGGLKAYCDKYVQYVSGGGELICAGCRGEVRVVFIVKERINA